MPRKSASPGEVIERGTRAVEDLPAGLVYAGFSLGVLPAQKLAQTRPGARGALPSYDPDATALPLQRVLGFLRHR
jgi:hypothetical protein